MCFLPRYTKSSGLELITECSLDGSARDASSGEEFPALKGCFFNVGLDRANGGKWVYKSCGEAGNAQVYYGREVFTIQGM